MWMERMQRLYATAYPKQEKLSDEVIAVGGNMVIVGDEMGRETRRIPVYPPRVVKHCPTCGQQIS
jgi:hypothetical protein